ncbi:bloom syndrome protein [Fusarium oxysporum f. sp. conglutinans race 2 54008]|uniref:Bloom syndrome protein n=1 Tax=Fusarium oxysporum f. sp. conglutinans race 2 54008 TaxID=1089457 RepID=X0GXW8_FUSOX|nr:bloom syndrome protein [Fusarium oxysporum f. sp. conglutinans race 2 54008]
MHLISQDRRRDHQWWISCLWMQNLMSVMTASLIWMNSSSSQCSKLQETWYQTVEVRLRRHIVALSMNSMTSATMRRCLLLHRIMRPVSPTFPSRKTSEKSSQRQLVILELLPSLGPRQRSCCRQ